MFRSTTVIFILLSLLSFSVISQKQKQTPKVSEKSDFDLFMEKADNYYKAGDYFRAKNMYDYCSKMNHYNVKEALRKKEMAINLLILRYSVKQKLNQGNNFDAQKIAYKILELNKDDSFAKNELKNLSTNENKTNTIATKSSKDKSSQNSLDKYNTYLPKKNISRADEQDTGAELEIIKEKSKEEQKLFESHFANGVRYLNDCNFKLAHQQFGLALKLRPNAPKTKLNYYSAKTLLGHIEDVEKYKNNPVGKYEIIYSIYDKVLNLAPKCSKIRNDYFDFVAKQIQNKTDKSSCNQLETTINKLRYIDNKRLSNETYLTNLLQNCHLQDTLCGYRLQFVRKRINDAKKLTESGIYDNSDDILNESLDELKSLNCGSQSEQFEKEVNKILSINQQKKQVRKCFDTQQNIIAKSDSLSDKDCKTAFEILSKIDTSCLDTKTKNTLFVKQKNARYCYRNQLMRAFEDSAARSRGLGYKLDEKLLLLKKEKLLLEFALENSETHSDSLRIYNQLNINDCKQQNNGECPSDVSKIICKDSSLVSLLGIGVYIGFNINNVPYLGISTDLLLNGRKETPFIGNNFFIGIKLQKYNFKKWFDASISLNYTNNKYTFSSLVIDNQTYNNSSTPLTVSSNKILIQNDLKYHLKNICPNKTRFYLNSGFIIGVEKSSLVSDFLTKTDIENRLNNMTVGYSLALGIDSPLSKAWNVEIFYNRFGSFYNFTQKQVTNPLDKLNTVYSQSYIGCKVGVGFLSFRKIKK